MAEANDILSEELYVRVKTLQIADWFSTFLYHNNKQARWTYNPYHKYLYIFVNRILPYLENAAAKAITWNNIIRKLFAPARVQMHLPLSFRPLAFSILSVVKYLPHKNIRH